MLSIRKGRQGCRLSLLAGLGISLYISMTTLVADDYLDAITLEAGKVEQREIAETSEDGTASTQEAIPPPPKSALSKEALDEFESLLKEQYRGTYVFYNKLSNRSREEIFENYVKGIEISELRKKVLKRYNHEKP